MGQLAEIVFESVEPTRLVSLIAEFIGQTRLSEAEESEIGQFINTTGDAAITLFPIVLNKNNICIQSGAIRILRHNNNYDVEFTWDMGKEKENAAKVDAIHETAIFVAARNGVDNYYCGIEPSKDEDTRFFTRTTKGPLFLNSK